MRQAGGLPGVLAAIIMILWMGTPWTSPWIDCAPLKKALEKTGPGFGIFESNPEQKISARTDTRQQVSRLKGENIDIFDIENGIAAVNTISNHYDVLRDKARSNAGIGVISKILVYPDGDGFRDYWGKLAFHKAGNRVVDESGYFEGIIVESRSQIPEKGMLTDIGFYQDASLGREELSSHYVSMKMIIEEISKETHIKTGDLQKEKVDLSMVSELVGLLNKSASKKAEGAKRTGASLPPCITVCICQDPMCSLPCAAIKCVEPRYTV